jgi:hypothetical protein
MTSKNSKPLARNAAGGVQALLIPKRYVDPARF